MHDYILWMMHDTLRRWRGMSLDRLVFDSIDPCFDPKWQAGHDRWERDLAERAKVVFCTARTLRDRVEPINPNSYLLPNAADTSSFVEPAERDDPTPVLGYLGTFDARVDVAFLERLVEALPHCRFEFAGRVNPDQVERVAGLRAMPNVMMPGRISNEEGVEMLRRIDVGLIPFAPGEASDAINPVKMHNYLAAGVPVLSTAIAECAAVSPPRVWTWGGQGDPGALLSEVLASAGDPDDRESRRAWVRDNTWADRAAEAVKRLHHHGLFVRRRVRPATKPAQWPREAVGHGAGARPPADANE